MTAHSIEELQRALRALGIRVTLEAFDALAVAVPEPGERAFESVETRRRAIELARSHGFSHLAVELPARECESRNRATLPRD